MKLAAGLLSVAFLTACSTPVQVVRVPVATTCIPSGAPTPPATSTNEALRAMPDGALILTIAAERLDLIAYAREADAVIKACR